jgi:hypothetical protein
MGKLMGRIFYISWASRCQPKPEILPEFMGPVNIGSEMFALKVDIIQMNECDTIFMSLKVFVCPEIIILKLCSGGMNVIPYRCV